MPFELRETMPLIVLVTAAMLLFVAISVQWTANEEAEQEGELEYLECKPLSYFGPDVLTFSGPAEAFRYDGEDWIRMTGVGTLDVLTSEGSKSYHVKEARLGLVLLTGQSNSVYFTNPSYYTDAYTIEPGTCFYFGTEDPTSSTRGGTATPDTMGYSKIVDLVAPDGTLRMSQMYPSFCLDYAKESGKRILVLNTGIGGQSISHWDIPGGNCAAWMTNATSFLKKAIEEDGNIVVEPLAALWSQGESDAGNTSEYYLGKLETLVERLEDGTWGYEYPVVLSVLPRSPGTEGMISSASAQVSFSEQDSTFVIASTLPVEFGSNAADQTRDGVHYTQEVFGWLGEAFARALAISEGLKPVTETIVFTKDLGEVSDLPQTVTAYGTSGEAFELSVEWTESEGSYTGELYGNPSGTRILEGLTVSATLVVEEESEPENP